MVRLREGEGREGRREKEERFSKKRRIELPDRSMYMYIQYKQNKNLIKDQ